KARPVGAEITELSCEIPRHEREYHMRDGACEHGWRPPRNSTFCVPLCNLEDKACCRRMRDQPISCIGDARLRGGDAAACIEHAALGADDAARLAHAAHERYLE